MFLSASTNENWGYIWSMLWKSIEKSISVMESIKVFDTHGQFSVSLFQIVVAVIIMGAVMNLFINFTTPTLPDESIKQRHERHRIQNYRRQKIKERSPKTSKKKGG